MSDKRDLYQEVTNTIVEALENGVVPWVRPWHGGGPRNAVSGRFYRGVNTLILSAKAIRGNYSKDLWLTAKQAMDVGGHIKKGEKATLVTFFKMIQKKSDEGVDMVEENKASFIPIIKGFWIFNVDQCENLPNKLFERFEKDDTPESDEEIERYIAGTKAVIKYGGDKACYTPALDMIRIPRPECFSDKAAMYSVKFHELGHWTGHETRCNRDLSGRFGNESYSAEELIAEIFAANLSAQFRLQGFLQHPQYIASWLRVLKNDKRAIFTASAKAKQACEWINNETGFEVDSGETVEGQAA